MRNYCFKRGFTLAEVLKLFPRPFGERVRVRGFRAFTLSEVLITLGVIGVVAAMTLPPLIQKHNDKVISTSLKKAYSVLSKGYNFALNEYGTPDNWEIIGEGSLQGATNIGNIILKNAKILKVNNSSSASGWDNYYSIYTNDGFGYTTMARDATCSQVRGTTKLLENVCAIISVDINGRKSPNTNGVDKFAFYLTKYGIIPVGTKEETFNSFSKCLNKSEGGACAAWVIYNENRDYLRCPEKLGWNKQKSCK